MAEVVRREVLEVTADELADMAMLKIPLSPGVQYDCHLEPIWDDDEEPAELVAVMVRFVIEHSGDDPKDNAH